VTSNTVCGCSPAFAAAGPSCRSFKAPCAANRRPAALDRVALSLAPACYLPPASPSTTAPTEGNVLASPARIYHRKPTTALALGFCSRSDRWLGELAHAKTVRGALAGNRWGRAPSVSPARTATSFQGRDPESCTTNFLASDYQHRCRRPPSIPTALQKLPHAAAS